LLRLETGKVSAFLRAELVAYHLHQTSIVKQSLVIAVLQKAAESQPLPDPQSRKMGRLKATFGEPSGIRLIKSITFLFPKV
jgi:hypothetical protein